MARNTFFSFHQVHDLGRASVVRRSSQLNPAISAEWIETDVWEAAKNTGDAAVAKLIDDVLAVTTVTAVLIGTQSASRQWVKYEIGWSLRRCKGLFGIYIHSIKDQGDTDQRASNLLPPGFSVYDWSIDDGRANLGAWVNAAYAAR
jgi:hypothetical protein